MEQNIKVSGLRINKMVKGRRAGQMGLNIRVKVKYN
jgi:hypothetical protein